MGHKEEKRECQNCKGKFIIEPEDFNFYQKISVPPPTFCPECRLQRKLAYRESRTFYKNNCRKCKIDLISIFSSELEREVYCTSCWWGDNWNPLDRGKDYDFSKSFFEQFYELQKIVPREATGQKNCENCLYSNGNVRSKNCLLTFDCIESINCYNCQVAAYSKDSIDIDNIIGGQQVFDAIGSNNIYNSNFIYYSDECLDSNFLYNCMGCSNCFGCVNLRNKKYYIFNKPYSKKDYEKEIQKWDLGSYKILSKAKEQFLELYYKTPRRFALIKNAENVSGDDIRNTKNCQNCFFTRSGVENCKNIFAAGYLLKDSYDATFGGDKSELFYETVGGMQSFKCLFTRAAISSNNLEYSERLINCSNCFGCISLKNKQYCILNKQYEKEKYFEMLEKIKQHMNDMPYIDKKGRVYKYGEFFPVELSLFAYNKTWANKFFPLSKKETEEKGFKWENPLIREYKIDLKTKDLPDNIKEVDDSILNKVIECAHQVNTKQDYEKCNHECTEAFKILPNELFFYRKKNLALPRLCPNCRHYERIKFVNPLKISKRECMKEGRSDSLGTENSGRTSESPQTRMRCNNRFDTAIPKGGKEIVYCKECYQSEFI